MAVVLVAVGEGGRVGREEDKELLAGHKEEEEAGAAATRVVKLQLA